MAQKQNVKIPPRFVPVGLIAPHCELHLCPDLPLVAPSGSEPGLRREGPFSAPAENPCEGPGWVMAPSVGQSLSRPALEDGPSFVAQEWGALMTTEGKPAPSVCCCCCFKQATPPGRQGKAVMAGGD